MQNIVLTNEDNTGSLAKFWFIPVSDVVSIPAAVDYVIPSSIIVQEGKNWYTANVTQDTPGFEDKETTFKGAKGRSISLVGFVPGHHSALSKLFRAMELIRFLVLAEDQEGNQRLLGSIENPMRFKFSFDTGNKTSSSKGYQITFFQTAKQSPYFYTSPFVAYPDEVSGEADFPTLDAYLESFLAAITTRVEELEEVIPDPYSVIVTEETTGYKFKMRVGADGYWIQPGEFLGT